MTNRTVKRRFTIDEEHVPDLPGMMLVTVDALRDLGGSATVQELDEKAIELEGVTETEQTYTMPRNPNVPRVNYYLAWARTYLKRGNALVNSSRGIWALTETGSGIMTCADTHAIHEKVIQEERERARIKRSANEAEKTENGDSIGGSIEEVEDWKSMLLAVVGKMPSPGFEKLSQRLLREAGFTKVEVRGKTGDGGIDGVGVLRVNLVSFQVYFQCKRWKGSVGPKEIRDFRGALQGRADKGLFITTGNFTSQASNEAIRDGAIAIDLINGDHLCELLRKYSLGVETEMIERVRIEPGFFECI